MNRLREMFRNKNRNIVSVYFTAGYPRLNSTVDTILELEKNGADMIEVGVPFSDPIADGDTIQNSSHFAIRNGINLRIIFEQIREARKHSNIPLVLMSYMNPLMQYGMEEIFKNCKELGVDGVIIPDLPLEIYIDEYLELAKRYDISVIMLISPETSEDRVKRIDDVSDTFIYMMSSASTTGVRDSFDEEQISYFKRISEMALKNPRLIGFGVSNKKTIAQAFEYANGAIVGSFFIKCVGSEDTIEGACKKFFSGLR